MGSSSMLILIAATICQIADVESNNRDGQAEEQESGYEDDAKSSSWVVSIWNGRFILSVRVSHVNSMIMDRSANSRDYRELTSELANFKVNSL